MEGKDVSGERYGPGAIVAWLSHSQGYGAIKRGRVVAFVPPGMPLPLRDGERCERAARVAKRARYLVEVTEIARPFREFGMWTYYWEEMNQPELYAPLASVVESWMEKYGANCGTVRLDQ